MVGSSPELPPARKSLVKEILCPQLALAIVTGALFIFTIFKPIKVDLPAPSGPGAAQSGEKVDPLLNSPEFLEKVAKKKPSLLLEKGKIAEAREAAWKASRDNAKRQSAVWNTAIGNVLVDSDDKRDRWKGYTVLEACVNKNPRATYPRLNYARKLYQGGFTDKAIEQYEALLKLADPKWVEPRLELANICLVDDKTLRAIELFKSVLAENPDDPRLIKRLGLAMAVNGNKDEGFKMFLKGCALEQDNDDYPEDIKDLIEKNAGLIESAISDVRQKVTQNPDDIQLRITLAKLLTAVRRYPAARSNLQEALKKRETVPEIHETMSEVLFRMGNREEALAEFGSTANLLPLSKPAASKEVYGPTIEDTAEEVESLVPPPPSKTEEKAEEADEDK